MSTQHRTRGVKVLKAVSSPLRLQILNFLFDKNALSYTELMTHLKMNPSRDAGKFAYHLKFLLKANLVEADVDTKKYYLTDLGKMLIDIADRVEKNALKPKTMLVRTSHSTIEEFDPNKIAHALIKEAKMPADQAQKTAKEAEKLLEKSKTKYLTAPLIREIVNALLIEKGQEDYRHKLTRLGLPVHEVTALIENKDQPQNPTTILTKAGQTIFKEYTLLNVLPRDITDAHTTGTIHINNLSTFLLRPNEIIHDLGFLLQNGQTTTNPQQLTEKPPETLEQALNLNLNVLIHTSQEIDELQILENFNLLLAPYTKNSNPATVKETLRLFICNLNRHINAAITLNLTVPAFIADKPATGPNGKPTAKYADFTQETQLLAKLITEIITEESTTKPLLNPRIIIKLTKDTFTNEEATKILQDAHKLAAEKGILYFANTTSEKNTAFSATGAKFEADLTGDWETDTLRTGCLGTVTINLPRIIYETEKDKNKFFDQLKEKYELATRALEIKARALRQHEKTVLPFLTQNANGDKYFRLENCSNLVNFAGLQEAANAFNEQDSSEFMGEIVQNIANLKAKAGRKHGKRFFSVILQSREASERLAQMDIEKYGVAKVKFKGTREHPFYSTVKRLKLQTGNLSLEPESLKTAKTLNVLNPGGNLSVIELGQTEIKPDDLMNMTKQLINAQAADFFTYNRTITYCSNCNKSSIGVSQKCPSCGAISTLTVFDRFSYS